MSNPSPTATPPGRQHGLTPPRARRAALRAPLGSWGIPATLLGLSMLWSGTAVANPTPSPAATVQSTALDISLADHTGRATLEFTAGTAIALDISGLEILEIASPNSQVKWTKTIPQLIVEPKGERPKLTIHYRFSPAEKNGLLPNQSTLTWPFHCGKLFPCQPHPVHGSLFSLRVRDTPSGQTTIHPRLISAPAPSYQVAWATGDYTSIPLGRTPAGTRLTAWYLPGGETSATQGTAHLVEHFAWLERTLGPYPFGADVAAVAVDWGGGLGGMEHHPYWHVGLSDMADPTIHAHEAAHGWFGGGVRIACWEDFVLSEGVASYLAVKSRGAVEGAIVEGQIWNQYRDRLNQIDPMDSHSALPTSCGVLDILEDGLFSSIPYMRGAFFFHAVEQEVGADALLSALATFYRAHVGQAARMDALLNHITATTQFDTRKLADTWLRTPGHPLPTTPRSPSP